MAFNLNGIILPDFPLVPEEYKYMSILKMVGKAGTAVEGLLSYYLFVSTSEILYVLNDDSLDYLFSKGKYYYYMHTESEDSDSSDNWLITPDGILENGIIQTIGESVISTISVIWSNHNIKTASSTDNDIVINNDIYYYKRILLGGVWLPDFPDNILNQYPYAAICYGKASSDSSEHYNLLVSETKLVYVAAEDNNYNGTGDDDTMLPSNKNNLSCGNTYIYDHPSYNDSLLNWFLLTNSTGQTMKNSNGGSYTVIWANHDIMYATITENGTDSSIDFSISNDIYFPSSVIVYDEFYYATYGWFRAISDQIRRISNTDVKLTSDTMITKLNSSYSPPIEGVKF